MSFSSKAIHIDRDDLAADHYADVIRNTHRTRLTFELLDIAKRKLQKQEQMLSHVHDLKMKEHARIENGFLRKLEQNVRLSSLPIVKETLRAQRRQGLESSSNKYSQEISKSPRKDAKFHQQGDHSKSTTRASSSQTERFNANLEKFNKDSLLS